MLLLLLHGGTGSWDEIAIAAAAFVVLWVAVKLAGRKTADADQDELATETSPQPVQVQEPVATDAI